MSDLTVPAIVEEGFGLEVVENHPARFRFRGNGDTSAIKSLEAFLRQVHSDMLAIGRDQVEVDLGELYIMNSSCMKQFIAWIHQVSTSGEPYTIRFWLTPRLRWQSRTLATFKRLAPDTVQIAELVSLRP